MDLQPYVVRATSSSDIDDPMFGHTMQMLMHVLPVIKDELSEADWRIVTGLQNQTQPIRRNAAAWISLKRTELCDKQVKGVPITEIDTKLIADKLIEITDGYNRQLSDPYRAAHRDLSEHGKTWLEGHLFERIGSNVSSIIDFQSFELDDPDGFAKWLSEEMCIDYDDDDAYRRDLESQGKSAGLEKGSEKSSGPYMRTWEG